jgi:hypothetical protein
MVKLVYEVLEEAQGKKTKKEKIEVLRANESWALKDVLRGALDSKISWLVPEGTPPYSPSQGHNTSSNLLRQNVQFSYFVKGGKGEQIMKAKREQIYITLLESIHPKDAELVIHMVSKNLPYKSITKDIVKEAFPGLIAE